MFLDTIDYLATKASAILNPKTVHKITRPISVLPKDCPALEVYPTKPTAVRVLTTDGTAELEDEFVVGFYTAAPESLAEGDLSETKTRAACLEVESLVPKLLALNIYDQSELPGVELDVVQISHRSKGGKYGIETVVRARRYVAPDVTP